MEAAIEKVGSLGDSEMTLTLWEWRGSRCYD